MAATSPSVAVMPGYALSCAKCIDVSMCPAHPILHSAAMEPEDRALVEKLFKANDLAVS